jgi:hypothetical protein
MTRTSLVLWLDCLDISAGGTATWWKDTRGAGLTLSVPPPNPAPVVNNGVSLKGTMLASPDYQKSSNCTLVVACSVESPETWGTIFGQFRPGENAVGRWHDQDVQLRVNDKGQVSWHTANDNEKVVLPLQPGIVVYACTMQSTATTSTMRMDVNGTVVSAVLGRTITEGTAPIVLGCSWVNEHSNAVIYELAYFNEALSPADCTAVASWMRQRWK